MKISIVIPAYNEAKRISETLERIVLYLKNHQEVVEVIVVLNNCIDETNKVVEIFSKIDSRIQVLDCGVVRHHGSGTKGYAVRRGFEVAKGEHILFMDADNSTDIFELDKLIPYIHESDSIIGSRYTKESKVLIHQSMIRIVLSRIGNLLTQIIILPGIKDTQCGFKLFSRDVIKKITPYLKINGWGFDIELLAYTKKFGFTIKEIGITWSNHERSMVKPSAFFYVLYSLFLTFIRVTFGSRFSDSN